MVTVCQSVRGFIMLRGLGISDIVYIYIFVLVVLKKFLGHTNMISRYSNKYNLHTIILLQVFLSNSNKDFFRSSSFNSI